MSTINEIMDRVLTELEVKELTKTLVKLALKPEIKADSLYTATQAGVLVDVSRQTIWAAIKGGFLQSESVGAEARIRGAAINAWLASGGRTGRSLQTFLVTREKARVKRKAARA